MFPVAEDGPASFLEVSIRVGVTGPVGLDLDAPVVGVRFGLGVMGLAAVPEAAVDEHSDLLAWEDEVGRPSQFGQGPGVDPVAQSAAVDLRAHRQLGFRISPAVALHRTPRGVARGP